MQADNAPRIYVEESGNLRAFDDNAFAKEEDLQALLAAHPQLLAGELFEPGEPLRWLLVAREMAIPDSEEQTGRWALDHLFVDQNGIPTFVEVKRASNTQLRREVIGQILDYAANGSRWWSKEKLVQAAQESIESEGRDYEEVIAAFLVSKGEGDFESSESFWDQVMLNLENGKVRLVVAADRLPSELVTVIEFLNKAMPNVQVVGLQLQQFTYENSRILVPRVRGLPEEKAAAASSRAPLPVNEKVRAFLERVRDNANEALGEDARRYKVTDKVRKVLYYAFEHGFGYGSFKVHFGGYLRDEWSPIFVGFAMTAKDLDTRNGWKNLLDALDSSSALPSGTKIVADGKQMVSALVSFDYADEDLTDALALRIVNTLVEFVRAIGPEIERRA